MTHTSTVPTYQAPVRLHPYQILMNLIATLLAPMFLGVTGGDVAMARMMAIQTVSAQRISSLMDLLAVAQIVAYGLAALGSLSLSMDDDLSLAMVLRLRGNANACTRSAEQNRRAIRNDRHEEPLPRDQPMPEPEMHHAEPWPETTENDGPAGLMDDTVAEVLAAEARERLVQCAEKTADRAPVPRPVPVREAAVPSPAAEKRHNEMWAIAMVNEASEITASIPGLPPAERHAASLRAGMLASTANRLLTGLGDSLPPFDNTDAGRGRRSGGGRGDGVDQRIEENVSYYGTNSHGAAFET